MKKRTCIKLIQLSIAISMIQGVFSPLSIHAQEDIVLEEQEEIVEEESQVNNPAEINIIDANLIQTKENTSIQILLDQEIEDSYVGLVIQGNNTLYTLEPSSVKGSEYTFKIELENGDYRTDYLCLNDKYITLPESISFSIFEEEEEEIEVKNAYYGNYDGFDYTGQTTNADRLKVIQKGKDIISFCWTAPFDMPTWKDESGYPSYCTDINGYSSQVFKKGHTYSGLPYTLHATGREYDDIKWKKLIESGNYSYSTFSGNYSFSGGITVTDTSIKGTDCSAFVSTCLNEVNTTPFYLSTYRMLNNTSFVKVTGFTKEERYDNLQPADMLLNNGHVMLYVGRDAQGWMYFYESLYPQSSVVCSAYKQSWLIDSYEAYRYNKLCDIQLAQSDTTLAEYLPIKTYGNASSIPIFDKYGTKKTTITASTLFTIQEIYTNGRCKVKYGSSEGYANTQDFLPAYSISNKITPVSFTTYRNSYNTTTLGSMSAGVSYLKVGSVGNKDCIIYSTTSGNYLGWIIPLDKQESIHGYSLSVSGDLCMNYYFELENSFTSNSNTTLILTIGNSVQRIKLSAATKSGSYYIFPCRVSAKDLTTTIYAQFDLGNGVFGKKYSYSIERYVNQILASPEQYTTKDINVARSMMTYGYYTQKYFGYRTNNLPGTINTLNNIDLSNYRYILSDNNDNVKFAGARLILGNKIGLKLYFEDKGSATFKVNGTSVQTTTEGRYRVITLSDISVLDKKYTITTTNFALMYYVFSYGNDCTTKDNPNIYYLMHSMYDFYQYYKA